MQAIAKDVDWLTVLDPDSPRWLVDVQRETIDAYRAGDLGWVLEHTHPDQSRNASISPSSPRYVRPSANSGGWTISMALPPAGRAHAAVRDVHEPRSRPYARHGPADPQPHRHRWFKRLVGACGFSGLAGMSRTSS